MKREFDSGFHRARYRKLVNNYPEVEVYPADSFRVEWGPVFHRGRLDGSARILILGQDPAAHEAIVRRILVGEAGQRAQGMLTRLGIDRSYVFINAFLYSVYGQAGGSRHINNADITRYRNQWINAIVADQPIEAIITLGTLADKAYQQWRQTSKGAANSAAYANVLHPTYPESASRSGQITKKAAFERLTASWNDMLRAIHPLITADSPVPLQLYSTTLTPSDLSPIPRRDLPAGLPDWMGDLDAWAMRSGKDAESKRRTIMVTVPKHGRIWPPINRGS